MYILTSPLYGQNLLPVTTFSMNQDVNLTRLYPTDGVTHVFITMTSCSTMPERAKNDMCSHCYRNLKYSRTYPTQQNNCSLWQQRWRSSRWSTEHCLNRIIRTTTSIHGTRDTISWRTFGRNTCQKTSSGSEICSNSSETNCVPLFTRLNSCAHRNEANRRLTKIHMVMFRA